MDKNVRVKSYRISIQILLALGAFGCGASLSAGNVPDGGGNASDAGTDAKNGFPEWWDPECGNIGGTCDSSLCRTPQIQVFAPNCGASVLTAGGCVKKDSASTGWGCWVRLSDGTILESLDNPVTHAGLETCQAAGLTAEFGYYAPSCPDGGGQ